MADHLHRDEREVVRREELLDLIAALSPRLPAGVVTRTRRELDAVATRLSFGLENRVVALVGGTGSGKSSLFNALSGLDVADVGTVRPSTSQPTACVWGSDAAALLDHLGVPRARRHRGEQALRGPTPGQLDGVVLLDVPDHDSVATGHRDQVDALLPLVDLLVWVLDPQKYADHRLHAEYLTGLAGRQEAMLAVVNQVDLLTPEGLAELRLDVARLLVSEGLGGVEVLTSSARTGAGIEDLREAVRRVSLRASANRTAVWDQLDGVARELQAGLGPAPGPAVDVDAAAERLAKAIGVDAVAESVEQTVRRGGSVASLRDQAPARIEAIRAEWFAVLADGLTPAWRQAIDRTLPSARAIAERATEAVRQVPIGQVARAGVLVRSRPSVLAREAEAARTMYAESAGSALRTAVSGLLAEAGEVRRVLTQAHEVLARPQVRRSNG